MLKTNEARHSQLKNIVEKKNVLVKLNITLTQWCVKPEKVVPGLFITDFYHGFYSSIGKIFLETVVNS